MSVNRDMESYELWKKEKIRALSGADRVDWVKKQDIDVAVYKTNDMITSGSARYNESTHTGLTYYKSIKAGAYQLRKEGKVFDLKGFNPDGRLAVMLLKEVDTDV